MARKRLLVLNDPHAMRINKELAAEIGLDESIILLQLDYLISISNAPAIDDHYWTYQSCAELHKHYFPFFSEKTIERKLKNLEEKGYIISANHNKRGYDRTKWYRINEEGVQHLKSVSLHTDAIRQNDVSIQTNCLNAFCQSDGPIPETPTETTSESKREYYSFAKAKENNTLTHSASAFLTPDADAVRVTSAAPEMRALQVYKHLTGMQHITPAIQKVITQRATHLDHFETAVTQWLAMGYKPTNVEGMLEWHDKLVSGETLRTGKPSRATKSRKNGTATAKPHKFRQISQTTSTERQKAKMAAQLEEARLLGLGEVA